VRKQIVGQKSLKRLEQWLARAVIASSLGEVLDEPS
jgi:hypothetical protein